MLAGTLTSCRILAKGKRYHWSREASAIARILDRFRRRCRCPSDSTAMRIPRYKIDRTFWARGSVRLFSKGVFPIYSSLLLMDGFFATCVTRNLVTLQTKSFPLYLRSVEAMWRGFKNFPIPNFRICSDFRIYRVCSLGIFLLGIVMRLDAILSMKFYGSGSLD